MTKKIDREELVAIKARHEDDKEYAASFIPQAEQMHNDRAALLDALEAAEDEAARLQHALDSAFAQAMANGRRALSAEAREERLREALELLVDHQNGCPLPKYEEEWTLAMQLSRDALAATAP